MVMMGQKVYSSVQSLFRLIVLVLRLVNHVQPHSFQADVPRKNSSGNATIIIKPTSTKWQKKLGNYLA